MNAMNINSHETNVVHTQTKDEVSFYQDVLEGLQAENKYLPSKYFYDIKGDKLFQDIMRCEEYYPFDCELEIFSKRTADLASVITRYGGSFDLIELGAGDCTKSGYLLKYLVKQAADFNYMPIDISTNIISYLSTELSRSIPGLKVTGLNGEYMEMLEKAATISDNRKVLLFLGSNLGNMPPTRALMFCRELRSHMQKGDLAIIGLDLRKDPKTILAAYNDKEGITRQFNLNLLERINRELNADFDLSKFEHYPTYDPATGACKSYLVSLLDQVVYIPANTGAEEIRFKNGECIFMEISQKYAFNEIELMAKRSGFKISGQFYDQRNWFVDAVWEAI
ncbi:L-histidine N(alpha)-methyltransferase [Chitinophaga sp. S165]|uniref:L-histidine N(alpha)-methyltransferase n=1 Tax=Chitinophaga sp. S165 TaxID=2135462 RepID=UPI000D7119CC|nr:L-histidine N(alpha)-methyltransferase [Chitinophaga sp. S165]PWV51558.1 dimethylhistidine N-methyltransferase [Chitinophaga sp. S165]